MKKSKLTEIVAALLTLLFLYTAVSKLIDMDTFRLQMRRQALPGSLKILLVPVLPSAEIIAAALLTWPSTRFWGLLLSAGLLAAFTGYTALAVFHFFDRVPCSCGGIIGQIGWVPHLLINAVFLLLTFYTIWILRRERRQSGS